MVDNKITIGIDIGQRSEPTGVCVVEQELRETNPWRVHFGVRHLDRIASGTSYPNIARRIEEISKGIIGCAGRHPDAYVDVTGLGQPIIDLLRDETPSLCRITPVYFTHGDKAHRDGAMIHLGKAYLVSNLQALLQSVRIHLPKTAHAKTLATELFEYEIQPDERANEREGAFRVGSRDDLVTALGLAVHEVPPGPGIY